jgi:glycosyltransferase involved in cell wall biosynthesis
MALSPLTAWRRRTALRRAQVLLATPDARTFGGEVVPPGVDVSRFSASPPVGRTIAYVGRFERRKGVRELIDAFAQVHETHPAAQLLMAGDGSDHNWIVDRVAQLDLESSVSLLGPVTPAEVATIFDASGVVCIPSHREPYGMVVLEAMAAGRAVVATAEGGPRFLLDDDGARFVPVGDPDALAAALTELIEDDELLARMGASNRRRVEREFSLTAMVNSLEQVYETAVAR